MMTNEMLRQSTALLYRVYIGLQTEGDILRVGVNAFKPAPTLTLPRFAREGIFSGLDKTPSLA
jgi:hypothetical protein